MWRILFMYDILLFNKILNKPFLIQDDEDEEYDASNYYKYVNNDDEDPKKKKLDYYKDSEEEKDELDDVNLLYIYIYNKKCNIH